MPAARSTSEDNAASSPPAEAPPADVFVSYAHADRPAARQLAEALQAHGLAVWWDRHLAAGSEFAQEIETRLRTARVVLALWSGDSVRSAFVRDECGRALRAGKLVPVRIEAVELPLGFGQSHTLDLIGWDGDQDDEAFGQLLAEVRQRRGAPPSPLPAPRRPGWLARRKTWQRAAVALAAAAVVGGGWWAWDERQDAIARREADLHFAAGVALQFAKEPELVGALNEYLTALEYRPTHARARYYLAHVHVQNGRPDEALAAFRLALTQTDAPLDKSLADEARKQIAALRPDPDEAAPVTASARPRGIRPAPSAAPPLVAAAPPLANSPGPAPVPVPSPAPTAAATPPQAARPAPAESRSVRVDAPQAQLAALAARVDAMFDGNRDRRVAATTGLIVDGEALSDAAPLALRKALDTFTQAQGGTLASAASSGVVNTLVLLRSASPATLKLNRPLIDALLEQVQTLGATSREQAAALKALVDQTAQRRPLVYLQIANEAQRPLAEALARRFATAGYDVPALEVVGDKAPARSEVRAQGKSERGLARWVLRVVGDLAGQPAVPASLRNARPSTDTYEVWLGRDLCATGQPAAPGCQGTAR